MIFGYICARIVAFTIAGFEEKIDAHELKNKERSHKTILSMKFHGPRGSLLDFKKQPNHAESV